MEEVYPSLITTIVGGGEDFCTRGRAQSARPSCITDCTDLSRLSDSTVLCITVQTVDGVSCVSRVAVRDDGRTSSSPSSLFVSRVRVTIQFWTLVVVIFGEPGGHLWACATCTAIYQVVWFLLFRVVCFSALRALNWSNELGRMTSREFLLTYRFRVWTGR